MENEKDIALLPPPPEQAETTEVPSAEENAAVAEPPKAETEAEKAEQAEPSAQEDEPKGNPLRLMARVGMILLGLFAVLILSVSLIDGIGGLYRTGIAKLALGELFGGSANISVLPTDSENAPHRFPDIDLSSTPANEQEDKQNPESEAETTRPDLPSEEHPPLENFGEIPIVSADLSAKGANGLALINETPYTPSLLAQSERAIPPLRDLYQKYGTDAPVVLILHTHGTESFAEDGAAYTSEEEYRSLDPDDNMLAVGRTLTAVLESRGINTIFCEEMFDAEDFTMAYYNASLRIRKYLMEYPSISYILDLHRDSIPYGDGGETIRPVTVIDGVPCAQIMFVVGTDHGGSGHTGWTDNFNLACRLQSRIFADHSGLMRAINLRSASFNQQYTKGSLLIEMGAVGSSLEEACNTAEILGEFLADEIIGDETDGVIVQTSDKVPPSSTLPVIAEKSDDLPQQGWGA